MKKIVCALLLAALVFAMPTVDVFAAESGSMWLSTTETSDSTTVLIVTDTTVTDGVVEVTYDSSVLTYQNVTVAENYVAMYSVNADTPGSVKISWVAPEAYASDGSGIGLIQVNFSGTEEKSGVSLGGTVNHETGADVPVISGPDTTELEKAILEAEGIVNGTIFTEDSFADMKDALAAAKNVLEDPLSSQKDIDDAANALRAAVDALELKSTASKGDVDTSELEKAIVKAEGLDKNMYTKKSYNVVAKELKDAKAVLADSTATQKEVDDAAKALNDAIAALELLSDENPNTGIESMMSTMIVLAVLSAAGIVIFGNKFMRRRAI
ncbi:MAG: FIVAR domain-containing protein [Oscillospiraceae bacterium]|nr:FIVAR domain-containing protein [Oscillospiraceae bacterium]